MTEYVNDGNEFEKHGDPATFGGNGQDAIAATLRACRRLPRRRAKARVVPRKGPVFLRDVDVEGRAYTGEPPSVDVGQGFLAVRQNMRSR